MGIWTYLLPMTRWPTFYLLIAVMGNSRKSACRPTWATASRGAPGLGWARTPPTTNVTAGSGPVFSKPYAARGMAVGDFNNDGALDVLVAINNGSPLLLKNQVGRQNHWLGVRLVAKRANSDAVGALITWQAGDLKRS